MIVASLDGFVEQGQQFGTLYIDPPWRYRNTRTRGAAVKHYPTMSLEDITALPVARLAASNSHVHLWTTVSFLHEALRLLGAWSFRYEGMLVWAKPSMGLGNYWRNATEFLVLGVKGECPFPPGVEISSIQYLPRRQHSEKPEEIRALIEQVSPGPYLELFARWWSVRESCPRIWTI